MCLTVHIVGLDMAFIPKVTYLNLMDSRLESTISKGFEQRLYTCKLPCCLQHFPSVKMRNNAAIPCDGIKMSLKAYKDEFIKHLNIIALSAQKKHEDIIITVREEFGCDSVNKACSHTLNEYKKTYRTAGSSLEHHLFCVARP